MKIRPLFHSWIIVTLVLAATFKVRAADVSSLPAQVDALVLAVSNLTTRVAALESVNATQAAQIADLQSKVNNLAGNGQTPLTAAIKALQNGLAQESAARLAGDMSTTQDAHAYADAQIAAAIAQEAAARSAGDGSVSQEAHAYADGKLAAALAQEAAARQAGDSAAIQAAQQYADSLNSSLLTQAKSYTDGQLSPVKDKLIHFSRSGNEVYISGANLHLVNGSGATYQYLNGLGNLIIGYNEVRNNGTADARTGSHNLVLGFGNNYTAAGGIINGGYNASSGHFASVLGGTGNTASGLYGVVVGGYNNTASGNWSTIGGGRDKVASGSVQDIP